MSIAWNTTVKDTRRWPDLTLDQRAWELAKTALGDNADVHALMSKAQEIKESLR